MRLPHIFIPHRFLNFQKGFCSYSSGKPQFLSYQWCLAEHSHTSQSSLPDFGAARGRRTPWAEGTPVVLRRHARLPGARSQLLRSLLRSRCHFPPLSDRPFSKKSQTLVVLLHGHIFKHSVETKHVYGIKSNNTMNTLVHTLLFKKENKRFLLLLKGHVSLAQE